MAGPGVGTTTQETAKPSIYFCGSIIRCGRENREVYERIIQELKRYGHVLTPEITDAGEDAKEEGEKLIHDTDDEWLQQADVVVAEVTKASFEVGYKIGMALALNKKILCLFRPSCGQGVSEIQGAKYGRSVLVRNYEPQELSDILSQYFTVTFPSL